MITIENSQIYVGTYLISSSFLFDSASNINSEKFDHMIHTLPDITYVYIANTCNVSFQQHLSIVHMMCEDLGHTLCTRELKKLITTQQYLAKLDYSHICTLESSLTLLKADANVEPFRQMGCNVVHITV